MEQADTLGEGTTLPFSTTTQHYSTDHYDSDITIKNHHPLPLMPMTFKLLHGERFFTELNLHNHLVRIREGVNDKTKFNTPTGLRCFSKLSPKKLCFRPLRYFSSFHKH